MRLLKSFGLMIILGLIAVGFASPQPVLANVPSGFFEAGTDFQIGSRWVRFINSPSDMNKLGQSINSNAIFVVTNNINMNGASFTRAGTFTGIIHGMGHTISNLNFQGSPLLANTNNGVIEGLNFDNIQIGNNTGTSNSILIGTNNGTLRNISYSITNTTPVVGRVAPIVASHSNGIIQNVVGHYELNIEQTTNFQFNSIYANINSGSINNTWIKGTLNVSGTSAFAYIPQGGSLSGQNCTDTINVNVVTHGALTVNLNNCFYSTQDREFNLTEQAFNQNYNNSRLRENTAAVLTAYQSGSSPAFATALWRTTDTTLQLIQNSRLGIAGRHPIQVRDHNNSLTTLNLYRTPVFNSNLINLSQFRELNQPTLTVQVTEQVTYSTNYSTVRINDEVVGRGGAVQNLGTVTMLLESDYALPTLRINLVVTPITNLGLSTNQPFGFTPTTSIGSIFDQNNSFWNDIPITIEGQYIFRISLGSSDSQEYPITIRPIISGISNGARYVDEVTPLITASSVFINEVPFFNDRSFSQVGNYQVVFPNLTPANIAFEIRPDINLTANEILSQPRVIRIRKNYERLFINTIEVNDAFFKEYENYVTQTALEVLFTPSFGQHSIRVEGVNNFSESYNFEVEPSVDITLNESNNQKEVRVVGALLFVDNVTVPGLVENLTNVGNYNIKVQLPETQFALNPGDVIYDSVVAVRPLIPEPLRGNYRGSVEPLIIGQGMDLKLNGNPIPLSQINQIQDAPGTYEILIEGKDGYTQFVRFTVSLTDNITQSIYYHGVNVELSAPNSFITFNGTQTPFDYTVDVLAIGEYDVYTTNIDGQRILVKSFTIGAADYDITLNNFILTLNVRSLHPNVQFAVNETVYLSARTNINFNQVGRYFIEFVDRPTQSPLEPTTHFEEQWVIPPRFNREIKATTNVVEAYQVLNDIQSLNINGRRINTSIFNESNEFLINKNEENLIVIEGINGELFIFESFFENPHFNTVLSLMWPAIGIGIISALSLAIRFMGVVRHER